MSNRTDKPKKSVAQLVTMMRDEKGITFNLISESDAAYYLAYVNNYMRTASYRKNYTKYQGGINDGKYENLDFAYLKELSTIDMYLRFLINEMCLDIEHALKVMLIRDIENDSETDGYDIVVDFLDDNQKVRKSIENTITSLFTGELIQKYFTISSSEENDTRKIVYKIEKYDDCPVWVLVELLSYGDFLRFYRKYYGKSEPIKYNLLQLVRSLRNGTAHNNCMISDLRRNASFPPAEIKEFAKKIPAISKTQRQKNLSSRPMLEFITMLYVYDRVVTDKVKQHHVDELKMLFTDRMTKRRNYFEKNELIKNNYKFALHVINVLFDQA